MNRVKPTISLCMIVRNEAAVIRRCLNSVIPIIDHWVIVDTGSTDGTQDIIRAHLADVPGTLYEREWQDFAHNRSESLALARPHADYSLVIDADDFLEPLLAIDWPELAQDCYTLDIIDPPLRYIRKQLVSNRLLWRFRGVLHEFIHCEQEHSVGHLHWPMRRNHDGARRRDPGTYAKDAQVLLRALETEQDPFLRSRYTFYLAQSYRDCQQPHEAIAFYQQRAQMGGWQEEVFCSLYQVAKLKEILAFPDDEVVAAYETASQATTSRIEALHGASRLCRIKGRYAEGFAFAKRGLDKPYPADALFGQPWIYETGLLDEFAVNAYWIENYTDCMDACLKILRTEKMSGTELQRVVANLQYALQNIKAYLPEKTLPEIFGLEQQIQIMDVGASTINEIPAYKPLLDLRLGHLHAFEGDQRQVEKIKSTYGNQCTVYDEFLFDGGVHTLYMCAPESGMTSLFKPKKEALQFFNGFDRFGHVEQTQAVQTVTMDSVAHLPDIDFLKMDIQGAELQALQNGTEKLKYCVAIQLEVSYVCLYEHQPSFGQVDLWMRSQGYVPHCFLEVKRWSISPTIFDKNFRIPGNQLLESDIVYIKDPLNLHALSVLELKKLAALAHYAFKSMDLCAHLMLELESRGALEPHTHLNYLNWANRR